MKSKAALVKCNSYNQDLLYSRVEEALSYLGGIGNFIRAGSRVLLKPNLLMAALPEKHITTHPEFVRAVIRILKKAGCSIFLGDGPSVFGRNIQDIHKVYEATGMDRVAKEENIELVDFTKRFMVNIEGLAGPVQSFPLASWVKECDHIINLPKFKTHEFMILTGAVKNLFGLVPGTYKLEFHKKFYDPEKFADALLNIYQTVKPCLSIIDAISGMEGNGPATSGVVRDFGFILAGSDAVSLDYILAQLMGVKAQDIFTNRRARLKNIGNTDLSNIEVYGEAVSSCRINRFKLPETSLKQNLKKALPRFVVNILLRFLNFRPRIDTDLCRLCEACIKNCPQKTIYMKKGRVVIDYSSCISCFCCREVCPYAAIKMKKSLLARILGTKE